MFRQPNVERGTHGEPSSPGPDSDGCEPRDGGGLGTTAACTSPSGSNMASRSRKPQSFDEGGGGPTSERESGRLLTGSPAEPPFHLGAYMVFLMLGLGLLTPWNIVLNA